ncbi:PIN domain-containing protein [Ottowia beijingensis]|uniref:PIN domain-containing protein n=1 Tax=Ottowia beijingensis TaxID=1207057 RepID=UPI00358DC465
MNRLCQLAAPVERHTRWRPQLQDPADEMVLETALNGAAHALVTFNVRDFKLRRCAFGCGSAPPGVLAHT